MSNYFEIFGIQEGLEIDLTKLDRVYTEILAKNHPDNHDSEEYFQHTSKMVEINKAYNILKNYTSRVEFLLEKQGVFIKTNRANVNPDMDYLMYLLDLSDKFQDDIKTKDVIAEEVNRIKVELKMYFDKQDFRNAGKCLLHIIYLEGILKHTK